MAIDTRCRHAEEICDVTPGAEGCEECLAAGETWVHLRLCLTCGHVGCCNESKNRHAQRHFNQTGHPVMRSFEPDEDWMWCFVDDLMMSGSASHYAGSESSKEFLRRLDLFAGLSEDDLDRLYAMTKPIFLSRGETLVREGEPGDTLFVILEGQVEAVKQQGAQSILLGLRGPGEVIGEMAVFEDAPRTATLRAAEDSWLLAISKTAVEALILCSPTAPLAILRTMTSRLRSQQGLLMQQEKMASLGTLSAGLAHELNNPAAAIKRSATYLSESIEGWEQAAADFGSVNLSGAQITVLVETEDRVRERTSGLLNPLERSEREDAVQDWLEEHDVDRSWDLAPPLVASGWDSEALEPLAEHLDTAQIDPAVRWLASRASTRELLDEVRRSAEAISEIVKGVKTYSHLDEAPVREIDVCESLENTLVILRNKIKEKGVEVQRQYSEVPMIEAYASELNQVWTNLIDNALDALPEGGTITLRTLPAEDGVVVQIEDNGPGIPADIQSRIFDAFYTTKPPGVGSGLGLHIVYNIVAHRHGGQIHLDSAPGETTFRVELPRRIRS